MTEPKDAFDQWHEWANKPRDSELSIPADLHGAVTALPLEERLDRDKVNRAVSEARNPNAQHIWIYESSDRLETFHTGIAAETWLKQNDPEGVAFKSKRPLPAADERPAK